MRKLVRRTFKLGLIVGAIGGLVFVGKKLMGGLGPEPGSDLAPKEWPSLVPEPVASAAEAAPSKNGSSASPDDGEASDPAPEADTTDA